MLPVKIAYIVLNVTGSFKNTTMSSIPNPGSVEAFIYICIQMHKSDKSTLQVASRNSRIQLGLKNQFQADSNL